MRAKGGVILLLVFVAMRVSAQNTVSGHLCDSIDLPVPGVSVVVCETASSSVVAFATSDKDGRYSLSFSSAADSLVVRTNSIFFSRRERRIDNRTQVVDFVMAAEVQELKGVTVTAHAMEQRGDTMEYSVGSFATKQDRSIEDVLKRMPGIEVEDDGKILYQGLPIQKFYVEGMDMMGNGYTSVSRNLPHRSVASVEVYENHQPIKLLEDRVASEQASLNIKLSNGVAFTGSGEVGIGAVPFLWKAKITPMLFSDKMQALATYQGNNNGEALMVAPNTLNPDNEVDFTETDLSLKSPSKPAFNQKRYLDNRTHLANLNTLLPIGKETQMRINLHYLNDLLTQTAEQHNKVFTATDTISFTEDINNRLYDQRLYGIVSFDRNSKKVFFNDKINFSKHWNKSFGSIINGASINQKLLTSVMTLSNDMRAVFPIGKHLLDFTSYVGYGSLPQTLEVEPGQYVDLLNGGVGYMMSKQEFAKQQFYTNEAISGIFTTSGFTISLKTGVAILGKKAKTQLSILTDDSIAYYESQKIYANDIEHLRIKPYINANCQYEKKRWLFTLDVPLSCDIMIVDDKSKESKMHMLQPSLAPSFTARLKIKSMWKIYSTTGYNYSVDNFGTYYSSYVMEDYADIMTSTVPMSLSQSLKQSLRVSFKQPFISLAANMIYSYRHKWSESMYRYGIDDNGVSILENVATPNSSDFHFMNVGVKKFFSRLRTNIGLTLNTTFSSRFASINGAVSKTSATLVNIAPQMSVNATSWLHLDYSFNFSTVKTNVDSHQSNRVNFMRHNIELMFFPGKDHFLCIGTELYKCDKGNFFYLDFTYRYSLSKHKIDFELKGENLTNNKNYVSYFSSAFLVTESVYRLRPISVMAMAKFHF